MAFYECKLCDKLFSQKSVYDDHVFIHKGIKPSVCSYCGKSFSNDSNKRQHEKTHTGGKTLRCNLCSKTYNDIKALKLHLENKHKQKSVPNIDSNVRTTEGHVQSEPQLTVEILSAVSMSTCLSLSTLGKKFSKRHFEIFFFFFFFFFFLRKLTLTLQAIICM